MITNNGKAIHLRRRLNVNIETLFNAWKNPAIFKAWWKSLSITEMDFRVGGKYRLEWTDAPEDYAVGEYKEIIPNSKIVMTWDTADHCGGKKSEIVTNSLITLNFARVDENASTIELIHELLPASRIDDHHLGW